MTHHWRASDHLEASFRAGEWRMFDGGHLIGHLHYGRINGKPGVRGVSVDGDVIGYAVDLEEACDRMWEWYLRTRGPVLGGGPPSDRGLA
jgi:hypothetical protein